MDLIEEYLNNLQIIHDMTLDDFGKKTKVRKTNKLADRNRQIATDIENKYPELKLKFCELLQNSNWKTRSQVAHHMLEVMNYSQEYRKLALDEIRDVVRRDILVYSLGNSMWLKQWYDAHPEDQYL